MSLLENLIHFDIELFLVLNGKHDARLDGFMYYISQVWTWIPLYLGMILFLIRKWRLEAIWIIVSMLLCLILTDQLSNLTKISFERLRPSHNPDLEGMIHHVKGYVGGRYGFVSGHASNVFGYALLTSLFIKNSVYTTFIFLWAIMVSYSRIYLGVHYPFDIVGGMLLGMSVAGITYLLLNNVRKKLIAQIKSRVF